jgi:hypothetical protein
VLRLLLLPPRADSEIVREEPQLAAVPQTTPDNNTSAARARGTNDAAIAHPIAPAVARLYRHALESIFAFVSLRELASVLRVSKGWATAMRTMRPLDAKIDSMPDKSHLLPLCMSPLARHVGSLTVPLSPSTLYAVSRHCINLHTLDCLLQESFPAPLAFPPQLRVLWLYFATADDNAAPFSDKRRRDLDAAIRTIASLPLLEELSIIADMARRCCLTPLVAAPALRKMMLELSTHSLESPTNIDALRLIFAN